MLYETELKKKNEITEIMYQEGILDMKRLQINKLI